MTELQTAPAGTQPDGPLWGDVERAGELQELATLLNLASQGEGAWVFALYASVATRQAVVSALQERVDLPFFEFTFGPEQVNPRDYLDSLPAAARDKPAVVCFYDLERALDRNLVLPLRLQKNQVSHAERPLVLGYLDLNRDWFARQPHSLLFWVTGYGRVQVATQAPNFWSRRNNVYDFRVAEPETRAALRDDMLRGLDAAQYKDVRDWRRQVQLYEKLLEEYLADESPDQAAVADLYGKLGELHYYTSHYDESRRLYDAKLDVAQAIQDQGRIAEAWHNQADLLLLQDDYAGAEDLYRRALAVCEKLGDRRGIARNQGQLANLLSLQGYYESAEKLFRRSLITVEELGERREVAVIQHNLANLLSLRGDYAGAEDFYRRALATDEELVNRREFVVTQGQLADLLHRQGNYAEAEDLYRRALAAKEELGDRHGVAITLYSLALMRQSQGRLAEALELLTRSRDIFEQLNLSQNVARVEELIAQIRQQMSEGREATTVPGAKRKGRGEKRGARGEHATRHSPPATRNTKKGIPND